MSAGGEYWRWMEMRGEWYLTKLPGGHLPTQPVIEDFPLHPQASVDFIDRRTKEPANKLKEALVSGYCEGSNF